MTVKTYRKEDWFDTIMTSIEDIQKDKSINDEEKILLSILHVKMDTLDKYIKVESMFEEILESTKLIMSADKTCHCATIKSKQREFTNMILVPQIEIAVSEWLKKIKSENPIIVNLQESICKEMIGLSNEYRNKK